MEPAQGDRRIGSGRSDAIGGLVLSLIGVWFWILLLPSILGSILSVRALLRLKRRGGLKVAAIVGLLLGVAGVSSWVSEIFQGSHSREIARRAACLNNLKNVTYVILTYASDHGGSFPTHIAATESGQTHYKDLGILYPRYATSLDIFTCPSARDRMPKRIGDGDDNKPFLPDEANNVSYAYGLNKNAKNKAWTTSAPRTTRVLADRHASRTLTKKSNHKTDGRNVAFADGYIQWIRGTAPLDSDPDNPDPNAHGTGPDWWSER